VTLSERTAVTLSRWNTSASGVAASPSVGEMSLLREHLQRCRSPGGRLFAWRCRAENAHRFMAARFVTTVFLVLTVMLVLLLVGAMAQAT
jgi:hypothetical protein